MRPDDYAYKSAATLAALVRQREVSPVELVEAAIARIEARNPSLNALVHLGFEDARREAKEAEEAVMKGGDAAAAARRAGGDQGPVRFQAGLAVDLRRRARAQEQHRPVLLPVCRAHREAAAPSSSARPIAPVMGLRGICRQSTLRRHRQSVRHDAQSRRLVGRQRRGGRRRHAADRRGHRRRRLDPHSGRVVRRLWLQGRLRPRAGRHPAERLFRRHALHSSKDRSRARSRMRRWR